PDGGNIGEVLLYDVAKFELVRTEKTFPDELHEAQLVGASRGWGFFFNREDRSVVISDFLNPYASKTEPKMFPLPMFTRMPTCQIEVVCNVAMSSSPEPYYKDWGVGVKFLGNQLNFCRPHCDLRWTNIRTPFESWDRSNLMYSKPKFLELVLHNIPNLPSSLWKRLDSLCREDHWVELPSGESFLVKWYKFAYVYSEYTPQGFKAPTVMVFREEDTICGKRNMRYTEDIGDLCIFISKGEDFCVEARSNKLKPNSILLNGRLFATINNTNNTFGCYEYPEGTPDKIPYSPYWFPPFSS
ncbi:hypothetical protein F2Q69_00028420, partial [Brassica cretica]